MWLSKKFGKTDSNFAETGTVSVGEGSVIKTVATVQSEDVQNYAPYGYSAYAPDGEEILLINSAGGTAGAGTKMKSENISSGEISITSIGNAKIMLKKNGDVEINGFVFTKDGKIINQKGEIVFDS
ncbi:MAG: hypothetical protein K2J55_04950 [Eubacterium sp.]|nr:hypothetical protein [Eubacterium sp.]